MNNEFDIADNSFRLSAKTFSTTQTTARHAIAYHKEQLEISKLTYTVFERLTARAECGEDLEALRLEAVAYLKARNKAQQTGEGLQALRHYA